ncbi:MAG: shikimate kinase [Phycisphaerae bacterium]|nr:MAG: shikimate kinase [Phycisphaerae bacterium]
MNVILVGLRGVGKTTLGRALAARRDGRFVDLDDLTAAAAGHTRVAEAFVALGESEFRRAEASALRVVLGYRGQVVALGGGTPTAPGVERMLADARTAKLVRVIYLRATPATLRARLAATDLRDRPSVTGEGALDEIGTLFERRDGLYQSLADVVLDVDGLVEGEVLERLVAATADLPRPPGQPASA